MSDAPVSLDPAGRELRDGAALGALLLTAQDDAWAQILVEGMDALAAAQMEAFPENIYADLEFVAASVLRQGRQAKSPELVTELCERMCGLQRLYGRSTPIRFRYVHDFTYGYDWAKWVRREPEQSGEVGPFDLDFLTYMDRRGHELLELIAADDRTYPTLRDTRHRNPFPFSREPADERVLFATLAARGLIPVETWRFDASPRCAQDFSQLRVQCAVGLGLGIDGAA